MKKHVISVTDAARNFAECVNRVRYQNVTFLLVKNGSPVAQLIPSDEKTGSGRELAKALTGMKLSKENAKAWRRDLSKARKLLKAPTTEWQ